jgi:acyl-CoA thioesterase YciA
MSEKNEQLAFRKMIMYPDLSVTGRLYGGALLSWIDEGMAILAMNIMKTRQIVTRQISEVNFAAPALLGDLLEIRGWETSRGSSSLTMSGRALVKRELAGDAEEIQICEFSIVFVAIDDGGKSTPWH